VQHRLTCWSTNAFAISSNLTRINSRVATTLLGSTAWRSVFQEQKCGTVSAGVSRAVSCTGLKIACVFRKGVDRVFVDHALFLERVRQAFGAMKRASAQPSKNDSTPLNPIMC